MKKPTITIVIPVFNVENFVNETLSSVKNQISQPDEVIVINDGSTDESSKILNNFSNLQGWKIIQTLNQGLGLTRNFGRSIANSDYIYFLDSDDVIKNDLIVRMREIINQYNNPDMILFSGESYDDNGMNNKKPNLKFTLHGEFLYNSKLITKLTKSKETLPQASRYITKTELWLENKLSYPEGIAEDEAVFFPLLASSKSTVVIPETYYRYRVGRPGSITLSPSNPKHAKDYLNIILSTIEFMTLRYDLVKADLSAWRYRLGRKGLNYVSMCLKTNTPISWITILIVFYRAKSISFPLKLLWRILRHFFSNNNLKK
jgi:glycosyltransferase involved in cell wall biosynthesis|tara:strand:- start:755 stop:1705 length:951 start_codon:yes stop_codon:yes gene_type:complete